MENKLLKYSILALIISLSSLFGFMKINNYNINDIGLNFLSWIKRLRGDSIDLSSISSQETTMVDHRAWSEMQSLYVTKTGEVNYPGFIEDKMKLEEYLHTLSSFPPGENWRRQDKLAYWINAYNAYTVKLIIDNYPLKSIKDIANGLPMINSPWDIKFFKIGETDFDLNTIEHEILRKQFDEPRIHFAINCASFSCPRLRNEAYETENLEEQLEEQTSLFINNPDKNIISGNSAKLSKLFKWFESDFLKDGGVKSFIKKYNQSLNENSKIEYLEYIWTLNE